MAAPIHQKIMRWIIDHFLWDVTGTTREGLWGWLCGKWRVLAAVAGAVLLTWGEWVKHHPPEIALIAVIHFLFVLVAIALVVQVVRWFSRSAKKSPSRHTNDQ
jgi:hypothetical protein